MSAEIIGFVGGALVTVSLLPQIYRVFKRRSARDISLHFTILLLVGLAFWLSYGLVLNLRPVILWNGVSIGSAIALIYAKIKYGRS